MRGHPSRPGRRGRLKGQPGDEAAPQPKAAGWHPLDWACEFAGTAFQLAAGFSVVALLESPRSPATPALPGWSRLVLIGIVFGVLAAAVALSPPGRRSGAHLNPAVTVGFWLRGHTPSRDVLGYVVAQVVGAFVGAAIVYFNYKSAIDSYNSAHHITDRASDDGVTTFSIFATFPAPYYPNVAGPFLDELIGTALLLGIVLALVDEFNVAPRVNIGPLLIGFLVFAIGLSFGANSGYAINPARDLGPRLFAWIQGWGDIAVPGNYANIDGYMWIPIVAPLVGGLVGALIYDFFIHNVLVARGPAAPPAGGVPEEPVGEPEPAGEILRETEQERPPGYAGSQPPEE
jgi:glycerol uptake facilitator protein